jgi:hypothetical protein
MQKINLKMLVAFACALYFLVASILVHFLKSDLSFFSDPLSRFAVGKFSLLLTIGFLAIGLCEILIGINSKPERPGPLFLILAGISVAIVAIVKMDVGNIITIPGQIHNWAALSEFTLFPIAVFLIAWRMERGVLKMYSVFTAAITLGLMATLVVLFNNKYMNIFGLAQKINILAITAWLITISGSKMRINDFSSRKRLES